MGCDFTQTEDISAGTIRRSGCREQRGSLGGYMRLDPRHSVQVRLAIIAYGYCTYLQVSDQTALVA